MLVVVSLATLLYVACVRPQHSTAKLGFALVNYTLDVALAALCVAVEFSEATKEQLATGQLAVSLAKQVLLVAGTCHDLYQSQCAKKNATPPTGPPPPGTAAKRRGHDGNGGAGPQVALLTVPVDDQQRRHEHAAPDDDSERTAPRSDRRRDNPLNEAKEGKRRGGREDKVWEPRQEGRRDNAPKNHGAKGMAAQGGEVPAWRTDIMRNDLLSVEPQDAEAADPRQPSLHAAYRQREAKNAAAAQGKPPARAQPDRGGNRRR
jgi:hypothetical protein